jgi:hypothetical protein
MDRQLDEAFTVLGIPAGSDQETVTSPFELARFRLLRDVPFTSAGLGPRPDIVAGPVVVRSARPDHRRSP